MQDKVSRSLKALAGLIVFSLVASAQTSSIAGKVIGEEREQAMAKNKALNEAFTAGKAALDAQKYDEAIASLTKASEFDPKQSVVWANLAEAYMGQSKTKTGAEQTAVYAKAYEAYSKAL